MRPMPCGGQGSVWSEQLKDKSSKESDLHSLQDSDTWRDFVQVPELNWLVGTP